MSCLVLQCICVAAIVGQIVVLAASTDFIDFKTSNGKILANGVPLLIKGANWFGFELREGIVQGIWPHATTIDKALSLLQANNFNSIRLPIAMDHVLNNNKVMSSQAAGEPRLKGKTYLEALDFVMLKAAEKNILVMLDNHRLVATNPNDNPVWYDGEKENLDQIIPAFKVLAKRYCKNARFWNVFAIDLKNQPHGKASWGTGKTATDWDLAATKLGNQLLEMCERWLVVVEGVQKNVDGADIRIGQYGGSLQGVKNNPVKLNKASKIVYSPHAYGPSVDPGLSWWNDAKFPANMPAVWTEYFGFVPTTTGNPPIVVGAWGYKSDDKNTKWAAELVKYMIANEIGSYYWTFNAQVSNFGGLVENDWVSPVKEKMALVKDLPSTKIQPIYEILRECSSAKKCEGNGECVNGKCKCNPGWGDPQCTGCSSGDSSACNYAGKCSNDGDKCVCDASSNGKYCTGSTCDNVKCGSTGAQCVDGQCFCRKCSGNDCQMCNADGSNDQEKCETCATGAAGLATLQIKTCLLILSALYGLLTHQE